MIREATIEDVPQMTALADAKRAEYEGYALTFWRRAEGAADKQAPFFQSQIAGESVICLVYEEVEEIMGFIVGAITTAPPVYDPGSLVCYIDDFTVAASNLWTTVGRELLQEARRLARLQGADLTIAVCGHKDEPKREMLKVEGLYVASEWYVCP